MTNYSKQLYGTWFHCIPLQKITWIILRWLAGLPKVAKLIFLLVLEIDGHLNQLANQLKPH